MRRLITALISAGMIAAFGIAAGPHMSRASAALDVPCFNLYNNYGAGPYGLKDDGAGAAALMDVKPTCWKIEFSNTAAGIDWYIFQSGRTSGCLNEDSVGNYFVNSCHSTQTTEELGLLQPLGTGCGFAQGLAVWENRHDGQYLWGDQMNKGLVTSFSTSVSVGTCWTA